MKADNKATSKANFYQQLCVKICNIIGNEWAFILSLLFILVWLVSGPFFNFSDTWQLIINTSTTIITFLIVFLIQNTQNRDTIAVQLKLDELLRCHKLAHNSVIDLDKLSVEDLKHLEQKYIELSRSSNDEADEDVE